MFKPFSTYLVIFLLIVPFTESSLPQLQLTQVNPLKFRVFNHTDSPRVWSKKCLCQNRETVLCLICLRMLYLNNNNGGFPHSSVCLFHGTGDISLYLKGVEFSYFSYASNSKIRSFKINFEKCCIVFEKNSW